MSIPKTLQIIFQKAAIKALSGLNESLQINPQKNEAWDY